VCPEDSLIHMLSAFPSVRLKKEYRGTERGSPHFKTALKNVMGKLLCLLGRGINIILQNSETLCKMKTLPHFVMTASQSKHLNNNLVKYL